MRRGIVVLATVFATLSMGATAAWAVDPISTTRDGGLHFVGTPTVDVTKTSTEAFLTATGEVAGAGKTATATLSATAEVTRGCINRGSKDQEPSGLQRSFTQVSGSTTFRTRSGRGTFTVETDPHITAAPFACPDQMVPVLVSVIFHDVTLTITSQTGTITAFYGDIDP
jgi:hypothetical protein